jgi:hypothetical protein
MIFNQSFFSADPILHEPETSQAGQLKGAQPVSKAWL